MTRTSLLARRGLRSKRVVNHLPVADVQTVTIPVQSDAVHEDQIWAVNAAVEAGRTELAYELADRYLTA